MLMPAAALAACTGRFRDRGESTRQRWRDALPPPRDQLPTWLKDELAQEERESHHREVWIGIAIAALIMWCCASRILYGVLRSRNRL